MNNNTYLYVYNKEHTSASVKTETERSCTYVSLPKLKPWTKLKPSTIVTRMIANKLIESRRIFRNLVPKFDNMCMTNPPVK